MRMKTLRRVLVGGLAAAGLGGIAAPEARAAASFRAEAATRVTVEAFYDASGQRLSTQPTDLDVTSDVLLFDDYTNTFGNASAATDGLLEVVAGGGVDQTSSALGDASVPSEAFSLAGFLTDGTIELTNRGTAAYTIEFRATYSALAEALVDDPASEYAEAFGDLAVGEYLVPDPIGDPFNWEFLENHVEVFLTSFSDIGDGLREQPETTALFRVTLDPGTTKIVYARNDAYGYAEAVPEPGSLALVGLGLAGLAVHAGRRRTIRRG